MEGKNDEENHGVATDSQAAPAEPAANPRHAPVAALSQLSNELILQIMEHLAARQSNGSFSLDGLKALSSVNRHFRVLSYGVLFRVVSLSTRPTTDLATEALDFFCRTKPTTS